MPTLLERQTINGVDYDRFEDDGEQYWRPYFVEEDNRHIPVRDYEGNARSFETLENARAFVWEVCS